MLPVRAAESSVTGILRMNSHLSHRPCVHGLKHYIVDENGQRVAPGQRGELWISGPQVCYGYLDLPEKNKKCFAPNPFSSQTWV